MRQRTVWEETTTRRLHEAIRFRQSEIVGGTKERFYLCGSASRAQQRQRSRSSYFGRWECDRCHICTFVDDYIVEVAVAVVRTYADEYDTDTKSDFPDREDEDITPITVSSSGRPIRAHFRLDFYAYIIYS